MGGIPKYWEFLEKGQDVVGLAEALYFDYAPCMEQEPMRILRDERMTGMGPLSVLEAVGRGSHRPSEIAQRLGYGESGRITKKTLYHIADPTIRFWFGVY